MVCFYCDRNVKKGLDMINDFKNKKNHDINIEQLVKELIGIVEDEVNAYNLLLDALVEQQSEILNGDTHSNSESHTEVKEIRQRTEELKNQMRCTSGKFSQYLHIDREIKLNDIIPRIEKKYAKRLNEFKDILEILSGKVESTNKRNQQLLENSLQFIDSCLRQLVSE